MGLRIFDLRILEGKEFTTVHSTPDMFQFPPKILHRGMQCYVHSDLILDKQEAGVIHFMKQAVADLGDISRLEKKIVLEDFSLKSVWRDANKLRKTICVEKEEISWSLNPNGAADIPYCPVLVLEGAAYFLPLKNAEDSIKLSSSISKECQKIKPLLSRLSAVFEVEKKSVYDAFSYVLFKFRENADPSQGIDEQLQSVTSEIAGVINSGKKPSHSLSAKHEIDDNDVFIMVDLAGEMKLQRPISNGNYEPLFEKVKELYQDSTNVRDSYRAYLLRKKKFLVR